MANWGIGVFRKVFGTGSPETLLPREVSMVRSDTRSLIRIANEMERWSVSAAKPDGRATLVGDNLQRTLVSAENRLAASMSAVVSRNTSALFIESEVVAPIVREAVVVSALAHAALKRATNAALHDARRGAPGT